MAEAGFIRDLMAPLAGSAAARGLLDDAAIWAPPLGRQLALTHDSMVEATHFLGSDPADDVAWKLLAVNASDLAAMGAVPAGCLLSVAFSGAEDAAWQAGFARGLGQALAAFGMALWGGDTVSGAGRLVLGLTAIGHLEPGRALGRAGAQAGDALFVSGTIGDAGLGLAIAQGLAPHDAYLLKRLRRPTPRLALGQALPGLATAAMDVSDGLLIDAARLAAASGVALEIDLAAVPLSAPARAAGLEPLAAATSGDDYELLFTAPETATLPTGVTRIGRVRPGAGLSLLSAGKPVPLPAHLGFAHRF